MRPASDPAQQLRGLHAELASALAAADWTAVSAIDQRIRRCLEALADPAALEPEARAAHQALHRLHSEALRACAQECERLRQRLDHHLDYAEGRSAYQRIGLMGGR
ncbi:hypothetical protein [Stutzerimonas urumqiensis]|uniref:hypothetical protein n=1 Tax=Stutzerimonas urumqiensis TaxID=638269 RepID=UPI000EAC6640|nr:hypothetical protein [Stutzerimonas urumqiensis]